MPLLTSTPQHLCCGRGLSHPERLLHSTVTPLSSSPTSAADASAITGTICACLTFPPVSVETLRGLAISKPQRENLKSVANCVLTQGACSHGHACSMARDAMT